MSADQRCSVVGCGEGEAIREGGRTQNQQVERGELEADQQETGRGGRVCPALYHRSGPVEERRGRGRDELDEKGRGRLEQDLKERMGEGVGRGRKGREEESKGADVTRCSAARELCRAHTQENVRESSGCDAHSRDPR
eukprot:753023-Hanusia_phi.AAC.5